MKIINTQFTELVYFFISNNIYNKPILRLLKHINYVYLYYIFEITIDHIMSFCKKNVLTYLTSFTAFIKLLLVFTHLYTKLNLYSFKFEKN